jgi:hypothetical protein
MSKNIIIIFQVPGDSELFRTHRCNYRSLAGIEPAALHATLVQLVGALHPNGRTVGWISAREYIVAFFAAVPG